MGAWKGKVSQVQHGREVGLQVISHVVYMSQRQGWRKSVARNFNRFAFALDV